MWLLSVLFQGAASFSFPVAVLTGLLCAFVWARAKPWVSPNRASRKEYILLEDLTHAKSFLSNLHDTLWSKHEAQSANSESISKAGEDVLLQRTASRLKDGRRRTLEAITGTLAVHGTPREVNRLRRKMRALAQEQKKEYVHLVVDEAQVLLQARLPITSSLLSQAFEVARRAIALDARATLQLGSWGVIMQQDGEVKLLRLEDGNTPVLLDSFREEDQDLRVEGLFLRGVQMRAAMGETSAVLRSKTLLKDEAGCVDALVVWPPSATLDKGSLLFAVKIVEFKGVTATVRSNLIPVSFTRKTKDEDHTGLFLAAALAFVVAIMPRSFWLPILGKIGMVFLPVFQLAAVILGWNLGHFLLLGEWPSSGAGDREVTLDSEAEVKEFGANLFKYVTPWDSAVRMEMDDLERQLAKKLESQPSASKAGIYAQQADYRTEYWRKGVGEMNQAIQIEPQNELPFRIRGCIKGLAGDYDGGLKDLDQALKLKPSDVLALIDRGVFRFLGGDLVGALADIDEAIKLDPAQPPDVLKLRDAIAKTLADLEELAKLREENPRLRAELAKAAADLEAARARAAADLEAAQAKAAAELEALRAKSEAEAEELRSKAQKLQGDLNKAQETIRNMPSNQPLEVQYNNLCCEKCVRDIKSALSKVPGVKSITEDFMSNKVTVTGFISPSVILSVCRQTSPTKMIHLVGDEAPAAAALDTGSVHDSPEAPESTPEPETKADPEPEPTAQERETKADPEPEIREEH